MSSEASVGRSFLSACGRLACVSDCGLPVVSLRRMPRTSCPQVVCGTSFMDSFTASLHLASGIVMERLDRILNERNDGVCDSAKDAFRVGTSLLFSISACEV